MLHFFVSLTRAFKFFSLQFAALFRFKILQWHDCGSEIGEQIAFWTLFAPIFHDQIILSIEGVGLARGVTRAGSTFYHWMTYVDDLYQLPTTDIRCHVFITGFRFAETTQSLSLTRALVKLTHITKESKHIRSNVEVTLIDLRLIANFNFICCIIERERKDEVLMLWTRFPWCRVERNKFCL